MTNTNTMNELEIKDSVVRFAKANGFKGRPHVLFASRETGEPGKSGVFSLWRRDKGGARRLDAGRGYYADGDGLVKAR